MKHVAALLFSTLLLTVPDARAQLAELHDADGNVVNGQTVVHWGDMQTANQKQGLDVVLLGSATKVVNVKRYELSVQTGTENYFCWGFATRRSMQVPSPSGRRSRSIRSCSTPVCRKMLSAPIIPRMG